jgi:uncharacterized protein YqgC (DUF456 family)
MEYVYAGILVLLNTLGLFLVVVGFPGTWFMVLASALISWLSGGELISTPTLVVLVVLALLGELLEFIMGAAGSRKAGGTRRGAVLSVVLSIIGGIVGTFAIPVPVIGSILGACIGAFLGALTGDLAAGRKMESAIEVGRGAFVGRLLGTLYKLILGVAMWIVATVASFV